MLLPLAIVAVLAAAPSASLSRRATCASSWRSNRLEDGRGHLWRNLVWGSAATIGGTALALASDRDEHPFRWAFGIQTAIWGGIDIAIAGVGLYLLRGRPTTRTCRRRSVRSASTTTPLLITMGLDVGYIAVGAGMLVAARKDFDNATCGAVTAPRS